MCVCMYTTKPVHTRHRVYVCTIYASVGPSKNKTQTDKRINPTDRRRRRYNHGWRARTCVFYAARRHIRHGRWYVRSFVENSIFSYIFNVMLVENIFGRFFYFAYTHIFMYIRTRADLEFYARPRSWRPALTVITRSLPANINV